MAINRYDKPAQLQLMNTHVPLPYQEIMQGLMAKEKAQEAGIAGLVKIGNLETPALKLGNLEEGTDYERVVKAKEALDKRINTLTHMTDLTSPEGRRALLEFDRYSTKAFSSKGIFGGAKANYAERAKIEEEYKKALYKKNGIKANQLQASLAKWDKDYHERGGVGKDSMSGWQQYQSNYIPTGVNMAEKAMKYADKVEASLNAWKTFSRYRNPQTGQMEEGYIFTDKGSNKQVSQEKILTTLLGADWENVLAGDINSIGGIVRGDQDMMNYLIDGMQKGYASPYELVQAIMGASVAKSFSETKREFNATSDKTHFENLKRGINTPIMLGQTPAFNQGSSEGLWEKATMNNEQISNTEKAIVVLQNKLAQLENNPGVENDTQVEVIKEQIDSHRNIQEELRKEQDVYGNLEKKWRNEAKVELKKQFDNDNFTPETEKAVNYALSHLNTGEAELREQNPDAFKKAVYSKVFQKLIKDHVQNKWDNYNKDNSRSYMNMTVFKEMKKTGSPINQLEQDLQNNMHSYEFKKLGENNFIQQADPEFDNLDMSKLEIIGGSKTEDGSWVKLRVPTTYSKEKISVKRDRGDGSISYNTEDTGKQNYVELYARKPGYSDIGAAFQNTALQMTKRGTQEQKMEAYQASLFFNPKYDILTNKLEKTITDLDPTSNNRLVISLGKNYSYNTPQGKVSHLIIKENDLNAGALQYTVLGAGDDKKAHEELSASFDNAAALTTGVLSVIDEALLLKEIEEQKKANNKKIKK